MFDLSYEATDPFVVGDYYKHQPAGAVQMCVSENEPFLITRYDGCQWTIEKSTFEIHKYKRMKGYEGFFVRNGVENPFHISTPPVNTPYYKCDGVGI